MKRTVLIFGLISGAVSSGMMLATLPFVDQLDFDKGAVIGYTSLVLSALVIFFGVRSYRDNVGHGHVGFGRAFAVGLLITLVSCACYVITWEILVLQGDARLRRQVRRPHGRTVGLRRHPGTDRGHAAGGGELQGDVRQAFDEHRVDVHRAFPIGLVVSLISAGILRRKPAVG